MGHIHSQNQHDQDQIEQRSIMHKMLANVKLQTKNKALEIQSRTQNVPTDVNLIRFRIKDMRISSRLQQAYQKGRR